MMHALRNHSLGENERGARSNNGVTAAGLSRRNRECLLLIWTGATRSLHRAKPKPNIQHQTTMTKHILTPAIIGPLALPLYGRDDDPAPTPTPNPTASPSPTPGDDHGGGGDDHGG